MRCGPSRHLILGEYTVKLGRKKGREGKGRGEEKGKERKEKGLHQFFRQQK